MSAEFESNLAARFAIELAKNEALRATVATLELGSRAPEIDRTAIRLIWSLGFMSGKQAGLDHAQEIMAGGKDEEPFRDGPDTKFR